MPAKECIGLNDVKGLLPKPGTVGEQNELETVTIGYLRPLYLTIENDQLLAQQSIFYNQIVATAGQV